MDWLRLFPKSGAKSALNCVKRTSSGIRSQKISTAAAVVSPSPGRDILSIPSEVPQIPRQQRLENIKAARPFSDFLTDTFERQHDYLRISLTEKCNLRCIYCMPEEGVPQSPPAELLTTPEIFLLSSVFVSQGVTKIRLTGGEPTVRRDIVPLMHKIGSLRSQGLRELCLTTNGISLHRKLDSMVEAGLTGVNLSLDTLDPWLFQIMTRRKGLDAVLKSIDQILEINKLGAGVKLKINCVVMRGMNEQEIIPFVEMGREKDIEVRFIEYMPFDGNKWSKGKMLGYQEMLEMIREKYPGLRKVQDKKNDTSKTFEIPGFVGKIGFITSMTHNFCGTCNRLRITSDGNLKVCLFGNAEVSLRDILRRSNNGEPIDEQAFDAMRQIELNRQRGLYGSEEALGSAPNERELLEVIGMAVKRKKEKHAGMGELENMKNRPMILIDKLFLFKAHTTQNQRPLPTKPRASTLPWTKIPHHMLQSKSSYPSNISTRFFSTSQIISKNPERSSSPQKLTHLTQSGSAHMVSISHKESTSRTAIAVCSVHFSSSIPIQLIQENSNKKGDVLGVARIAGIMAAKKTSDLVPLCHPIAISHVSVELEIDLLAKDGEEAGEAQKMGRDGSGEEEVLAPWAGTGQGDAYPWYSSSSGNSSPVSMSSNQSYQASSPGTLVSERTNSRKSNAINITATVSCDGKTGVEMEALTAASIAALTVYDMCKAVDKGMRIEGLRVVRKEGGKSGPWISD